MAIITEAHSAIDAVCEPNPEVKLLDFNVPRIWITDLATRVRTTIQVNSLSDKDWIAIIIGIITISNSATVE